MHLKKSTLFSPYHLFFHHICQPQSHLSCQSSSSSLFFFRLDTLSSFQEVVSLLLLYCFPKFSKVPAPIVEGRLSTWPPCLKLNMHVIGGGQNALEEEGAN